MQLQAQNEFCYIQARSTDDRAQSDFNDPALNVNQMMSLSLVAEMNPKRHRWQNNYTFTQALAYHISTRRIVSARQDNEQM